MSAKDLAINCIIDRYDFPDQVRPVLEKLNRQDLLVLETEIGRFGERWSKQRIAEVKEKFAECVNRV